MVFRYYLTPTASSHLAACRCRKEAALRRKRTFPLNRPAGQHAVLQKIKRLRQKAEALNFKQLYSVLPVLAVAHKLQYIGCDH